ncbi:MAG: acyl-phosphate glycerol 3-phosphate acyltransferase [Pelagibacterales bacterium]|nr:acyl-phosphate glycerol 3-phosphate acyltransferase [Pelagibacterales bacterium]|tara:strand:- start:2948 stop:3622 length:675 start_codon:yes stop_codon:yes gene_type:complete
MINNFVTLINTSSILFFLIVTFIVGSIPFGLIITKLAGYGDIRKIGSGNIGATNVLRTGNKILAFLTLILDILKSFLLLLISKYTFSTILTLDLLNNLYILVSLASVLGHMYSPFLRLKGGKGIATSAGILLFMSYPVLILTASVWVLVAIASKKSSLGALTSSLSSLIFLWSFQQMEKANIINDKFIIHDNELYLFAIIIALIWGKHIPNIIRLLNKSESNIS